MDPEEILEQVEDIYAGFDEKKGWLFANYTSRVSTEKAVDALLQEGQRALDFAEQNDALFHVQNSPHFARSTNLPNEQSIPLEFARLWIASEALFVLAAALETGTLPFCDSIGTCVVRLLACRNLRVHIVFFSIRVSFGDIVLRE